MHRRTRYMQVSLVAVAVVAALAGLHHGHPSLTHQLAISQMPVASAPSFSIPSPASSIINAEPCIVAVRELERQPDAGGAPTVEIREILIAGVSHRDELSPTLRRVFRQDGGLYFEVPLRDGQHHGTLRSWHSNGTLASEEPYEHGQRNGVCKYFDDAGRLIEEGPYDRGYQSGLWTEWHGDGLKASEGQFTPIDVNGKYMGQMKVGYWTFWHVDGVLDQARTGLYVDGQLRQQ